jgi:hypothetical protein
VLAARKEMGGETSRIQQMVDEEFQNVTKKSSAASSSELVS